MASTSGAARNVRLSSRAMPKRKLSRRCIATAAAGRPAASPNATRAAPCPTTRARISARRAPRGAELDPDGDHDQVWFRIAEEAIGRMPEKTPAARGQRLVDALIVWITPARPIEPGINRFAARVSEAGDTWIERLPW